jgi:hypothetical protein
MTVATTNDSTTINQATFLKVGQSLYRNESSSTYYGLTKRGGKQFRTSVQCRMDFSFESLDCAGSGSRSDTSSGAACLRLTRRLFEQAFFVGSRRVWLR